MNYSAEGRRMTVEIISWSISTKVWDWAGIELGLHLLCKRPEVFMIPWTFQNSNSFLNYSEAQLVPVEDDLNQQSGFLSPLDCWTCMCGSRRGSGGPGPLENDKNKGFLSNTGPDPLKNNKSFKRAFNVLCLVTIGPPAKRHLNGVSLPGRYWPALSGTCI